jgi:hypothetical protein
MSQMPIRQRYLLFSGLCLVLAIVAAIAASWIPLAILVIIGAVFLGRGLRTNP